MNIKKILLTALLLIVPLLFVVLFLYKSIDQLSTPQVKTNFRTKLKFIEVSSELGVEYEHRGIFPGTNSNDNQSFLNQTLGAAPSVSVIDINRDGFLDIYITQPELGRENLIYINNKGESFSKASMASITDLNQDRIVFRVLYADFNKDGFEDFFFLRWGCHELALFDPNSKDYKFIDRAVENCSNPWSGNIADLNKDGFLDVIVANYFPAENLYSKIPEFHAFIRRGDDEYGGYNGVLINEGGKKFKPSENYKFDKYKNHTTTAGVTDLNNDGWVDLYFANDFTYDRLYLNGPDGLKEVTFDFIKKDRHGMSGMNSEFVDLNEDLYMDLYVSNLHAPPFANANNTMWINREGKAFEDISKKININRCGWSWGGKFVDFDLDGDLDLIVGNGFYRGEDVDPEDPNSYKNLWFHKSRRRSTSAPMRKIMGLGNVDGGNIVYSGLEKNCLFENQGDSFVYVSDQAGLDRFENSRATIPIDYNNDGRVDFVMANYNDKLTFYRNETEVDGNWLGIDLRNKQGSIAFGARVVLFTQKKRTLMKEVNPLNGFGGQSDWRLHFGLGDDQPIKLEVDYNGEKVSFEIDEFNKYKKIQL